MLTPVTVADMQDCFEILTSVLAPRLNDFGPTFTCVLHGLGHTFPGHLIGITGGAHCELVLYCCQQCQV